ncbi:MAG: hypothetical protein KAR87_03350 [Candidatus Aenigmarchaeota archaeon]|nr:hypothetical protein [Candidatus Aenigmarchaeota archaeon]
MKLLFVFSGHFTFFSHLLAKTLQDKYKIKDICGIVIGGEKYYNFLKNQKEVNYKFLYNANDSFKDYKKEKIDYKYISSIEKKYGTPTFWSSFYVDRNFIDYNHFDYPHNKYSHEEILQFFQYNFKLVFNVLEKTKPDYIISEIGFMPEYILYSIAKQKKIPFYFPRYPLRVNNRMIGNYPNPEDKYDSLTKIFRKLLKNQVKIDKTQAIKYLNDFRKNTTTTVPKNNKERITQSREYITLFNFLQRTFKYMYNYFYGEYKYDPLRKRPLTKTAKYIFNLKFGPYVVRKLNVFEKPAYNEKYILFPLHSQPDISTLVLGQYYLNQVALIENIAKSMPICYKLYVKEHPTTIGIRSMSFYKRLKNIPNVKLIDSKISMRDLIKHSKLVTTISGTGGWEAIMLKKPVITFGDCFYNELDMVKKCRDITQLPSIIQDLLYGYNHDEEKLIKFLSAIFKTSYHFSLNRYMNIEEYNKNKEKILNHPDFKNVMNVLTSELKIN